MKSSYRTRIRVLRLCSVFEPPPSALVGRGVKFDPIGGMQNHTAELTRALDRRGVVQTVLTTRPPSAPYFQRLGDHARVIRLGLPVRRFRQLSAPRRPSSRSGPRPPGSIACRWASPSTRACATPSPSATF